MTSLLALTPAETIATFERLGARSFQAKSARRHVFERGVTDWSAMTDLSFALRERLKAELPILTGTELARTQAKDGAIKLLTGFEGTAADSSQRARAAGSVETVHLPSTGDNATLCVSTQVGCPVRCPFCASGANGLERSLNGAEILEQYVRGLQPGRYTRTVVMGIGEPLLNMPALTHALNAVRDEIGLGARRITVSTVGFPDRLRKLAPTKPRFQLAISLHSPFDDQRAELVPMMKDTSVEEILDAGDFWFESTGREVTYEYVLLAGENDSEAHARALADRLRRRRCTVNLIPYNPSSDQPYRRPAHPRAEAFAETLREAHVVATVRWSKGLDADAACGQLRQRTMSAPPEA